MKKLYTLSFLPVLLLTLSLTGSAQTEPPIEPQTQTQTQTQAQSQTESQEKTHSNTSVTEGTLARISLQTQLSSKLNEVGDQVIGVLYEAVRSSDGRVAIPRGTEFQGRITQVQAAKRPQKQASMTIVFESVRMPYGTEKISTVVTAIDDYAHDEKYRSKGEEGKVGAGKSGGKTAENAGKGAGLGGVGAVIIGAAGGGLAGIAGAIGAGAVGGVLMTKGNELRLEPGTILRIKFERDLPVPATAETIP